MTVWNDIYKNYEKGGEAWATLSEEIHPLFIQFLTKSSFIHKHVLDIGCGTGKYLRFLTAKGFHADCIDSSPVAIKMTREMVSNKSSIIKKVDMFKFVIPKNKYDLIISISTIHHGSKKDVQKLIDKIHSALALRGKVFITFPDFGTTKKNNKFFREHKLLKNGAYAPITGAEKGLAHSFYTKKEIQKLFENFQGVTISLDNIGRWVVRASK